MKRRIKENKTDEDRLLCERSIERKPSWIQVREARRWAELD